MSAPLPSIFTVTCTDDERWLAVALIHLPHAHVFHRQVIGAADCRRWSRFCQRTRNSRRNAIRHAVNPSAASSTTSAKASASSSIMAPSPRDDRAPLPTGPRVGPGNRASGVTQDIQRHPELQGDQRHHREILRVDAGLDPAL